MVCCCARFLAVGRTNNECFRVSDTGAFFVLSVAFGLRKLIFTVLFFLSIFSCVPRSFVSLFVCVCVFYFVIEGFGSGRAGVGVAKT